MAQGLIQSILEEVAKFQNAKMKEYQNISHIMTKECEILVPNKTEEYTFRLNEGWKIIGQDKDYLIVRRN